MLNKIVLFRIRVANMTIIWLFLFRFPCLMQGIFSGRTYFAGLFLARLSLVDYIILVENMIIADEILARRLAFQQKTVKNEKIASGPFWLFTTWLLLFHCLARLLHKKGEARLLLFRLFLFGFRPVADFD